MSQQCGKRKLSEVKETADENREAAYKIWKSQGDNICSLFDLESSPQLEAMFVYTFLIGIEAGIQTSDYNLEFINN